MTIREFLKEVGIDVIEDTQGTLDLEIVVQDEARDIWKVSEAVNIDYNKERVTMYLFYTYIDIEKGK